MLIIVDYGLGNLASVKNMFSRIGRESIISRDRREISRATKLVLPGVGSFDEGIKNLHALDLVEILNLKVLEEQVPVLGICLGMQLMTSFSEEGDREGLNWIDAKTVRFSFPADVPNLRIPHMGWNSVEVSKQHSITAELPDPSYFYFVHSYHVVCRDSQDVLMSTHYGGSFTSAFQRRNIIGVQFHPEKSHRFGRQLLANFAGLS